MDSFLDETGQILTNWTTPAPELSNRLRACVSHYAKESDKNLLNYS